MTPCTKNSDRDCCYTCTRLIYEMSVQHTYCPALRKVRDVWEDACKHFDRIFQGFGE